MGKNDIEGERINIFALTEKQKQKMVEEMIALGRKMVDLAGRGNLRLGLSVVRNGTLFLSKGEGEGYLALGTDKFGFTQDLSLDNLGRVPIPTILGAIEQMRGWVEQAERNS